MNPVKVAESDVVYKGPNQDIGDLWCHRVQRGMIRTTWEPDDVERELLARGGRIQLTILREPIPPVRLMVVSEEESRPVGGHGWKIDVEPGDDLENKKGDGSGENDEDAEAEQAAPDENDGSPSGQAPEAESPRASVHDVPTQK